MTLLKMACNAGASNEALALFSRASITREGENAVDWQNVARQLQQLVATLPTAVVSTLDSGLLVEEEDEDELAA
ncbi:MAG: hypothetical protein AB7I01_12410 [Gammaproteobacteria bacterium]